MLLKMIDGTIWASLAAALRRYGRRGSFIRVPWGVYTVVGYKFRENNSIHIICTELSV